MSSPEQAICGQIQAKGHILLVTHFNPDGDALGSQLGLADILEGMGKQVLCYLEEPVSPMYRFLPGCSRVQTDIDRVLEFVTGAGDDFLMICLDCGEPRRLGRTSDTLSSFHPMVVIDHHRGNSGFGEASWIEPHRSSTGEMIYDLAGMLGAEISVRAAECLYTAIMTDTGSFRYESTSPHTFAVAGDLVDKGVRPERIASLMYDNYTLGRLRLMQEILATLEMHARDRIAVIRVTQKMLERTFTTMEDTEHCVDLPRAVTSVRVAVFLKEIAPQHISVSLRAKGACDVSVIARQFGGGGHRNASGYRVKGQGMDEALATLLEILKPAVTKKSDR
ncbi:MAG: DHH family phosphoesterase [Desulfobulbus sp.]|jgi:phosphoesterase RecJ-like protein